MEYFLLKLLEVWFFRFGSIYGAVGGTWTPTNARLCPYNRLIYRHIWELWCL